MNGEEWGNFDMSYWRRRRPTPEMSAFRAFWITLTVALVAAAVVLVVWVHVR